MPKNIRTSTAKQNQAGSYNNNINFIILNRYNYTNMVNLGNPYGLLQDSSIVPFFIFLSGPLDSI